MKPAFAFIESNTTGTGALMLRSMLAQGFDVLFLCQNPERYPFLQENYVVPTLVDTTDEVAVLAALRGLKDLRGVFSSSEYYLEMSATVARALDLPGADPAAVATCRDKARLAEVLQHAEVPCPLSVTATHLEAALQFAERVGYPVVAKPVSGSGSINVRLCRDAAALREHVTHLLAATHNERGLAVEPRALIQSYIDGREFSVEAVGNGTAIDIVGITQKHLTAPPHFLEIGHDFPAVLNQEEQERIKRTVIAALNAVGLVFGPSHTEIRLAGNEAVIIEINPRLAGGMIPALIDRALGCDLLGHILSIAHGRPKRLTGSQDGAASIRFVVGQTAGRVTALHANAPQKAGIDMQLTKPVGSEIPAEGDFRDRVGFVIAAGADVATSARLADEALAAITFTVAPHATAQGDSDDTGRLKAALHPEALGIVRKRPSHQARQAELNYLADIDEAHLLMLHATSILSTDQVTPILAAITDLRQTGFAPLLETIAPRGTYLMYEGYLIDQLGMDLAGRIHTGRSRNDINATVFRLALQPDYERLHDALWRLRAVLIAQAERYSEVAMPIYSQYQPGLPGSYGYYLLAVENALGRDQTQLQEAGASLATNPLGAGAGGGTGFPIDCALAGALLGFTDTCSNALDAVAGRDGALRIAAAATIAGTTLSRAAQDFQLWTTCEFGFFDLPDNLAGGSSMMPQKKNPYLLEMIKGRAQAPLAMLTQATAIMQKTPFSNSVEVGTEAIKGQHTALTDLAEGADLLRLIVAGAVPNGDAMARSMRAGVVVAAMVSDELVRHERLSFRAAHHRVGYAVRAALDTGADAHEAVAALLPAEHALADNPATWRQSYEYGGGPGPQSTAAQLARAKQKLAEDGAWIRARQTTRALAEQQRRQAVQSLIDANGAQSQ